MRTRYEETRRQKQEQENLTCRDRVGRGERDEKLEYIQAGVDGGIGAVQGRAFSKGKKRKERQATEPPSYLSHIHVGNGEGFKVNERPYNNGKIDGIESMNTGHVE